MKLRTAEGDSRFPGDRFFKATVRLWGSER